MTAIPRALLLPDEATSEGARLLRVILRRQTFGAIARRLGCDEKAVRRWGREECRPSLVQRARCEEILSIPAASWDEKPTWV